MILWIHDKNPGDVTLAETLLHTIGYDNDLSMVNYYCENNYYPEISDGSVTP